MYSIEINPQTSPRPRMGKYGVYMPPTYVKYKKDIISLIKPLKITPDDYTSLDMIAYFTYPKSTAKKNLIEGARMRVKPDGDNCLKALKDCIQTMGLINNDSQLHRCTITKLYTTNKIGRIEFKLEK